MKPILLATTTALILSISSLSFAKTPALTTPSMSDQEYAHTLGFTLKVEPEDSTENDKELNGAIAKNNDQAVQTQQDGKEKSPSNSDEPTISKTEVEEIESLPLISKKELSYQCDISLAQPFAVKNHENIELALGNQKDDSSMVIKIRKTPLLMQKSHYEPEHLHIWSNTEHNVIMTLEVEEVYKDKFVALQSGTLTILTPKLKEDYKAVLTCKP